MIKYFQNITSFLYFSSVMISFLHFLRNFDLDKFCLVGSGVDEGSDADAISDAGAGSGSRTGAGASSGAGSGAGLRSFVRNIFLLNSLGIFFLTERNILRCLEKTFFQLILHLSITFSSLINSLCSLLSSVYNL